MALFDFFKKQDFEDEKEEKQVLSNQFVHPNEDGAVQMDDAVNDFIINFDWSYNSQAELIRTYRDIASFNEVDYAIEDIVNEMVTFTEDEDPVELDLSDIELSENMKNKIHESWDSVSRILDLKSTIHRRVKQFYIDGRLGYHKVVDEKKIKRGLLDIVELDVQYLTKIKNIEYDREKHTIKGVNEYFIYNENDANNQKKETRVGSYGVKEALRLNKDSISYITSGLTDPKTGYAISWLHKAVKPANQLRMMENALVVYRITRAPERRVFYVDVQGMPKNKAESYLRRLKNSYRNRMSYDPETGSYKDQKHFSTMQEDYWLPRSSSGKGTEVDTLPGGQNLSDIADVEYFLKRLYKALQTPVSRLEADSIVQFGRQSEINRDELKFTKFVSKIRKRFNMMFLDLLKTDLILKKIMTIQEWKEIEDDIKFKYAQDMYLEEQKQFEMFRDRLDLVEQMKEDVGKYYSHNYVRREILKQTDQEIEDMDKEMDEEKNDPRYKVEDDGMGRF